MEQIPQDSWSTIDGLPMFVNFSAQVCASVESRMVENAKFYDLFMHCQCVGCTGAQYEHNMHSTPFGIAGLPIVDNQLHDTIGNRHSALSFGGVYK